MFGLSPAYLILILVVIILLFGTLKLKNLGKDLGGALKGFKESMKDPEEQARADKELKDRTVEGAVNNIEKKHTDNEKAEQGDTDAQFNLGVMYNNGQGVTQDYTQAVSWYRKAAEQGHADAQFNLGVRYAKGQGVTKDYTQAVSWFRKAAEQGHANAVENLKRLGYNV